MVSAADIRYIFPSMLALTSTNMISNGWPLSSGNPLNALHTCSTRHTYIIPRKYLVQEHLTASHKNLSLAQKFEPRPKEGLDFFYPCSAALLYRNIYLTLIASKLSPKRDCGPKRDKCPFSTALYRNMHPTLIPSNLSPKRDCGPKRDKYRFSTALYRNMYLTLIPSNLFPKRDCGPKWDYNPTPKGPTVLEAVL